MTVGAALAWFTVGVIIAYGFCYFAFPYGITFVRWIQ
jgi:hypothetical protein